MTAALFYGEATEFLLSKISFRHLFIYFLPSDSAKQPQNQSPTGGRKNQTLKHQRPCEVLPCGTFLKITVSGDCQDGGGGRGPGSRVLWGF